MAILKDGGHFGRGGETLLLQGRERGADLGAREGLDLWADGCMYVCVCRV